MSYSSIPTGQFYSQIRWEDPSGRIQISNMGSVLGLNSEGTNFSSSGTLNGPTDINLNGNQFTFSGTGPLAGTPIFTVSQSGSTGYITINGALNVSGGIDPTYIAFEPISSAGVNAGTGGAIYVSDGTDSKPSGDLIFKKVDGQLYDLLTGIGEQGSTGPTGALGNVGPTGPLGVGSNTGPTGAQGIQGNTGPTGAQGHTGPTGAQGIQGNTGYISLPSSGSTGALFYSIAGGLNSTGAWLPVGASGTSLISSGTGTIPYWGITPVVAAGSNGNIQFNSSNNILGASPSLTWDGTNLTATELVSSGSTTVGNGLTVTAGGIVSNNRITITSGQQLRLGNITGTEYVDIFGSNITSIYSLQMPTAGATITGQVLTSDTSGNMSWSSPIGPIGPVGPTGPVANTGPTGAQGIQGIQGNTGPTGAQGIQGNTGPTGAQGIQGNTGPTGAQGIQGNTGPTGAQGIIGPTGPINTDITLSLQSGFSLPTTGIGMSINAFGNTVPGFTTYNSNYGQSPVMLPSPQLYPLIQVIDDQTLISMYPMATGGSNWVEFASIVIPSNPATGGLGIKIYDWIADTAPSYAWSDTQFSMALLPGTRVVIASVLLLNGPAYYNASALSTDTSGNITVLGTTQNSGTVTSVMGSLGITSTTCIVSFATSSANVYIYVLEWTGGSSFTSGASAQLTAASSTLIGNTVIILNGPSGSTYGICCYTLWNGTNTTLYASTFTVSSLTITLGTQTIISSSISPTNLAYGFDVITTNSSLTAYILQYTTTSGPYILPLTLSSSGVVTLGTALLLTGYNFNNYQPTATFASTSLNGWIVVKYNNTNLVSFLQLIYSPVPSLTLASNNLLSDYISISLPILRNIAIPSSSMSPNIANIGILYDVSSGLPNFICSYTYNIISGVYVLTLTPPLSGNSIFGLVSSTTNPSTVTVRRNGVLNLLSSPGIPSGLNIGVNNSGTLQAEPNSSLYPVGTMISSNSISVNLR